MAASKAHGYVGTPVFYFSK